MAMLSARGADTLARLADQLRPVRREASSPISFLLKREGPAPPIDDPGEWRLFVLNKCGQFYYACAFADAEVTELFGAGLLSVHVFPDRPDRLALRVTDHGLELIDACAAPGLRRSAAGRLH